LITSSKFDRLGLYASYFTTGRLLATGVSFGSEADLIRHFGQVRFAAPSGRTRALLDTFVRCHDLKLTINRRGASG